MHNKGHHNAKKHRFPGDLPEQDCVGILNGCHRPRRRPPNGTNCPPRGSGWPKEARRSCGSLWSGCSTLAGRP
jgi:hypothetical protein